MSVNRAILLGRVGQDPTVRVLSDDETKVANFSLATSESYKNKNGEKVEATEWHRIVTWRWLADFAESHIVAGMGLYIEGKITNRSWEDKDGNKSYTTEIVADKIDVTDWNRKDGKAAQDLGPAEKVEEVVAETTEDDDLPF